MAISSLYRRENMNSGQIFSQNSFYPCVNGLERICDDATANYEPLVCVYV